MNREERLQLYTQQIVALGQAALGLHRRGEGLPSELAEISDALLALETDLLAAPGVAEAAVVPAAVVPAAEEVVDDLEVSDDDLASLFASLTTDKDDWPIAASEESSALLSADPGDDLIVLDIDQEPGDIDAALDELSTPVAGSVWDETPVDEPPTPLIMTTEEIDGETPEAEAAGDAAEPLPRASEATPEPAAAELRFCINCGETLRPGKRFCHRCGTPVEAMVVDVPAADVPPAASPLLSEMPTYGGAWSVVTPSGAARYQEAGGAPDREATRYCNNCGMGIAPGVTLCPECGSRDIG